MSYQQKQRFAVYNLMYKFSIIQASSWVKLIQTHYVRKWKYTFMSDADYTDNQSLSRSYTSNEEKRG